MTLNVLPIRVPTVTLCRRTLRRMLNADGVRLAFDAGRFIRDGKKLKLEIDAVTMKRIALEHPISKKADCN